MKILLLISEMARGGAETHLYDLACMLTRRGHQVTVSSAGGELASKLGSYGIRHEYLPWNTHHPLRLWKARRGLIHLIKREHFDLIHAHARLPAACAFGVSKKKGIPLIVTVHARFRVNPIFRLLSRWGDRTVAVSEDLAEYVEKEYGVMRERITVIPNGIDTDRFLPNDRAERGDKPRILFFSRLDGDCSLGAELLLDIAPRLWREFGAVELWIAGGGEKEEALRRSAERICAENPAIRIRFFGHVEAPEEILPRTSAVIAVSRCAMEAMACGVPVILGGNEGFLGVAEGEILTRGEKSNFCCRGESPMTADRLFNALRELLSRTEVQRQTLGQALRGYVMQHHGREKMVDRLEVVYRLAVRKTEQKKGVLLCGYYGFGNMGDDALLRASVCRAREEFPDRNPFALTKRGRRDSARFEIPCVCRSSPFAVRRAIGDASVLVFGGGTLLQDQTSLQSLLYYAVLLRYAQQKGLRTVLWGNGLTMPHTAIGTYLLRWALVGCDLVELRDDASVMVAREVLGSNCALPIRRTPDLVLAYPPRVEERGRVTTRLGIGNRRVAVVIPRGKSGAGLIRLFCRWVTTLTDEGLLPVVVPMFPQEDLRLCRRLCADVEGILAEDLTPGELIALMGESEIVCGMRLHALVFSSLVGTPFVGFGADSKIESFCRERGGVYFTDLYQD